MSRALILLVVLLPACSDDITMASEPDAPAVDEADARPASPDARPDARPAPPDAAAVGCDPACSPAADCVGSACECPPDFIAAAAPVLATQMIDSSPGFVSGVAGLAGSDLQNHLLIVSAAETAPTGVSIAMNDDVYVAIGYQLDGSAVRSTYLATGGQVTLSRRCATGIAGTVTGAGLVEVNPTTLLPIGGGCGTSLPDLTFDIGAACP
jgi:hypothetical protein